MRSSIFNVDLRQNLVGEVIGITIVNFRNASKLAKPGAA